MNKFKSNNPTDGLGAALIVLSILGVCIMAVYSALDRTAAREEARISNLYHDQNYMTCRSPKPDADLSLHYPQ